MAQHLRPEDVGDDFLRQAKAIDDSINNSSWNKKVIGQAMIVNVQVGFLKGEDPEGKKWMSSAAKTKLGGKFAESYKKRPSDDSPVTASSLRLTDSGQLREHYDIVHYDKNDVVVGPVGERNINIATSAETRWGNTITGWGDRGLAILDSIVRAVIDDIARGKRIRSSGYVTSAGLTRGF